MDDLEEICNENFDVELSQHRQQPWNTYFLTIVGFKAAEAKSWLLESIHVLERLNFPADWLSPVQQYMDKTKVKTYEIANNHPSWNIVNRLVGSHAAIESISIIQNVDAW
jgi:hypothetical protein